jgi:hypothetical protein
MPRTPLRGVSLPSTAPFSVSVLTRSLFPPVLDAVTLRYDYRHHTLVTLVAGPQPSPADPALWHLPTLDPRNENKYHYPLHSLDVYFWTRADTLQFVNGARRVLPAAQCDVTHEPAPPPQQQHQYPPPPQQQPQQQHQHNEMSAVVQQLENVAIAGSVPPPPPLPAAAAAAAADYVPMAYNPAAPAAPEAVRHREKTPPPPQDPSSDPRVMAVAYEQNQGPFSPAPFSPYFPHNQQPLASPGFAPPPGQQPLGSPAFAPPGHLQFQRANTQPVPGSPGFFPGSAGPGPSNLSTSSTPSAAAAASVQPPASAPPTQLPAAPVAATAPPPQQHPLAAAAAPPGGEYAVHTQHYVPDTPGRKEGKTRIEENAGRLERGVTGMFKKFEKKFG